MLLSAFLENVTAILAFHPLTYISWRSEPECVRRLDISFPRDSRYISLLKAYLSKKLPFPGESPDEQRKSSYSPSKGKHRLVLGVQVLLSTPGSSRLRVHKYTWSRVRTYTFTRARRRNDTRTRSGNPRLREDPSNLHRSLYTCRGQLLHVSRFMVSRLENIPHPFSSRWERTTLVPTTGREI